MGARWMRERIEAFCEAWNAGIPTEEIAARFGLAPQSVTAIASQLRAAGHPVRRIGMGQRRRPAAMSEGRTA